MKEQLSDKEHYLTNINWKFHMKLTLTEPYPTTRPTTVSKSTESFFSLISSEIFVPTSAGRISIKVLQASFRIRLSCVGTSCQSFTGKRKVIFTNLFHQVKEYFYPNLLCSRLFALRKNYWSFSLFFRKNITGLHSGVAGIKQCEMKPAFETAFSVFSPTLAFCPNARVLRGVMIASF